MNININKKNVLKALALSTALVLIIYGGIKLLGNKKSHNLATLLELPNNGKYELFYRGVLYQTPDKEYSLKVINDKVYAVKEYAIKIDDEVREEYENMSDVVEVDGELYRYVKTMKEPIVVKHVKVDVGEPRSM